MEFRVLGQIDSIETIAAGNTIRELSRLVKLYGVGRWRKRKGNALIELASGTVRRVEVHWYEAHGVGRKELKVSQYLE